MTYLGLAPGRIPTELAFEIARLEARLHRLRARAEIIEPALSGPSLAAAIPRSTPAVCSVPCAFLWELDA